MQRTVIDNRYEIIRTLGGGGMARVYLAHDEVLGRDVALKILRDQFAEDEQFAERFKREAKSAASLTHPNIVSVYDRGEAADGTAYIAMEHVGGGTLKERITREGSLEPEEVVRIALQITEALGLAHRKGVIHRDIKPHNVLLTKSGDAKANADAKVTDFGIARAVSSTTISQTSLVMGTVSYMSPEQALGKPLDHRTDLYSLGVVLYEMLTGDLPHAADNPVAVSMKHVNDTPHPPRELNPGIPRDIESITMKLLAKDPDERYRSAFELARDLRRVREGMSPLTARSSATGAATRPQATRKAGRPAPPPTPPRKRRSLALRGVFAVALVLLALIGVGWALSENPALISGGPGPTAGVEIPNVVGQSRTEAQQELRAEGFRVDFQEQESSTARDGQVLEQSPSGGDLAREGFTVTLTVGGGPAPVEVPNVVGMSVQEAEAALEDAELTVGLRRPVQSETAPSGVVFEQGIPAGTTVEPGTDVNIGFSTGPPPVQEDTPDQSTSSPQPSEDQSAPPAGRPAPRAEDDRPKPPKPPKKPKAGGGAIIERDGSGVPGGGAGSGVPGGDVEKRILKGDGEGGEG